MRSHANYLALAAIAVAVAAPQASPLPLQQQPAAQLALQALPLQMQRQLQHCEQLLCRPCIYSRCSSSSIKYADVTVVVGEAPTALPGFLQMQPGSEQLYHICKHQGSVQRVRYTKGPNSNHQSRIEENTEGTQKDNYIWDKIVPKDYTGEELHAGGNKRQRRGIWRSNYALEEVHGGIKRRGYTVQEKQGLHGGAATLRNDNLEERLNTRRTTWGRDYTAQGRNNLHGGHTARRSDYPLKELHGGRTIREEGSHADKTSQKRNYTRETYMKEELAKKLNNNQINI